MAHGDTFRIAQERLREYIEDHELQPGDRLPSEASLASALGISRISLREATRSLQSLGVIRAQSGSGLFVTEFSFTPILDQLPYRAAVGGSALHEVLVVRAALEAGLIEMVSGTLTPADLDELESLTNRMSRAERKGEPLTEIDKAFHLRLYRPLGNGLVTSLIDTFFELFTRLAGELPGKPGRPADVHRDIVAALRAGEGATQAMVSHFDYVRERLQPLADGPVKPERSAAS